MTGVVQELAPLVGTSAACSALEVPRGTYYRHMLPPVYGPRRKRPAPARALSRDERQAVLDVLGSERFVDTAPAEAYATLLDDGKRLCSPRTMYRILSDEGQVRERRDQLVHPAYVKPELLATAPNQVWSWDITKLRAHEKWTYYYLYVLLDIYSRYVVGWLLAHRESGELAKKLVADTIDKQGVDPNALRVHADRGSAPKSKTLAQLYIDLGVEASFSRPRVSNDNPFSEAHFKTMKYQPTYPERFGSYEHALSHSRQFFPWYNHEHRHTGIAMLTPADVHYGRTEHVLAQRQRVLDAAYAEHPERFVNGPPRVKGPPAEVWINPPKDTSMIELQIQ